MSHTALNALNVFLTVARLRSFNRAAKELGISTPAVSQAVRQLEGRLAVPLLVRTTRSVALTDAGRRLLEGAGPPVSAALAALERAAVQPGELTGRLRLSVPRFAASTVIEPVLPRFLAEHPRVSAEVVLDDRLVDLVEEGFDAGVRLSEAIQRDMVQVRLTEAFRFVVVGTPAYLARKGTPEKPRDLLEHECIVFRSPTTGAAYQWEFERGRQSWRIPVRGPFSTNDSRLMVAMAERGLGLAYVGEPAVEGLIARKRLRRVLEPFAPTVPGLFIYFPSRAQISPALRAFIDLAREVLLEPGVRGRDEVS